MGAVMTTSDTIRLHAANGMTAPQIAGAVGVSAGYVRSVLSRDKRNGEKAAQPKRATAKAFFTGAVAATGNSETHKQTETPETKKTMKRVGETPAAKVLPGVSKKHPWLLWASLALSLGCSIPNMLWVSSQMKGDFHQACAVTAAFTIAPFLLLAYGVSGWLRIVPYVPIAVEVFCNASGFYGGMTRLNDGYIVRPTPFLHMVTTMTNSGNEGTAAALAVGFAICIALLAIVPVVELEKRGKQ